MDGVDGLSGRAFSSLFAFGNLLKLVNLFQESKEGRYTIEFSSKIIIMKKRSFGIWQSHNQVLLFY